MGELIEAIKRRTSKPLAVITNGSLLWDGEVRAELMAADVVIPSLDAGTQDYFETVNRPCPGLCLSRVVEGLECFSREFKGRVWLEVFLLGGIFDPRIRAREIGELVRRINPFLTQLNTVARPPCESFAEPVKPEVMNELLRYFPGSSEVIADFSVQWKRTVKPVSRDGIMALLSRRPCKSKDIAAGMGLHHLETLKLLEELVREKEIEAREENHETFYMVSTQKSEGEK